MEELMTELSCMVDEFQMSFRFRSITFIWKEKQWNAGLLTGRQSSWDKEEQFKIKNYSSGIRKQCAKLFFFEDLHLNSPLSLSRLIHFVFAGTPHLCYRPTVRCFARPQKSDFFTKTGLSAPYFQYFARRAEQKVLFCLFFRCTTCAFCIQANVNWNKKQRFFLFI